MEREMNESVYVVMGSTGEYSDRGEWPVVAYSVEDDAKAHVERAQARAREIFQKWHGRAWHWSKEEDPNEHDPDMCLDYTGTTYYVMPVPLATPTPAARESREP